MPHPKFAFFLILALFNTTFLFASEDINLTLDPIIVTKNNTWLTKAYSLKENDIQELVCTSPLEALSLLPIDLQSRSLNSGIQSDFSLRGSNFQGVLLLMDGHRLNDPQTGHHNCDIPVTSLDIKRIEVIPGAASSLFGPDTIGGAVNIISKKPDEKKCILELGGGQYDTTSILAGISNNNDNSGIRFSLERKESGGFRYDTDFKKFTASLASFVEIPDGEFNLNLGYQEKEFGAYDFYTPGLGYPSREWTKTILLASGLKLDKNGFMIRPDFIWRRHYDKFVLDKTMQRSSYLAHHSTDVFTPNIYFQKETYFGNLGLGLEYGQERINSTSLGEHIRNHESIFFDAARELNSFISLGASFRSDNFDSFNQIYTGSANLKFLCSLNSSFSLGLARNIRLPSFTELYYNDPTTIGNSSLSAEKSLNYQAGYDYKEKDFSAGLTCFFRQEEDMIDWIKRTPLDAKWQAENITEDRVWGTEAYLNTKLSAYIYFDLTYTYINKDSDKEGWFYKYGQNYTKHLVNNTLKFKLPFGVQTISAVYKKKPNRRGWFLLDAYLSYDLNKKLHIFSRATNLFNVEYQEIEGIPQPGRWIEGGLRIEW